MVRELTAAGFNARIEPLKLDEDGLASSGYDEEEHPEWGSIDTRKDSVPAGTHGLWGFVLVDRAPDQVHAGEAVLRFEGDLSFFEPSENLRQVANANGGEGVTQLRVDPDVEILVSVDR